MTTSANKSLYHETGTLIAPYCWTNVSTTRQGKTFTGMCRSYQAKGGKPMITVKYGDTIKRTPINEMNFEARAEKILGEMIEVHELKDRI